MPQNFLHYDPSIQYLFPPSLEEWVAEDSLARFVHETVATMDKRGDLDPVYAVYSFNGVGHPAHHPCMMVKVLLYGYCKGVTSSRRLATALEDDIAFRFLSANQLVDHRRIAEFRVRHNEALRGLFVKILDLCREAGLVKLGRVALDGRKVKGNAALDQNRTGDSIDAELAQIAASEARDVENRVRLAREVTALFDEAEQIDAQEDQQFGPDRRGDELPEDLTTSAGRKQNLARALERLEERKKAAREAQADKIEVRKVEEEESGRKKGGRPPKAPEQIDTSEMQVNTTDPESQILKARQGYTQGYNGQAMVDCESQVIVAQDLVNAANDVQQLKPMIQRCEEQAGAKPQIAIADAGYCSASNLALQTTEMELIIATANPHTQREAEQQAAADAQMSDFARALLAKSKDPETAKRAIRHDGKREPAEQSDKERMTAKLKTERGRDLYKQRGSTVEPVFGQMVNRGLVHFVLRGLEKVGLEWSLWCTSHNLLKLFRAKKARPKVSLGTA